jgi:hypothetical protein
MNLALRLIEIRRSRIHGRRLFARRDIATGSRLIQYVGRRIPKEQSDSLYLKENSYIFTLNDQDDTDGKVSWNPARPISVRNPLSPESRRAKEAMRCDPLWIRNLSFRRIAR